MESNRSFSPSHPKAGTCTFAKSMHLTKAGELDDYLEHQKNLAAWMIQVVEHRTRRRAPGRSFYDLKAFRCAPEVLLNSTPERLKQRKQYQKILETQ